MSNNSISCFADTERTVTGPFTGSFQTLGSVLSVNPIIMILDNQSDVDVEVSTDGTNTWKTFSAGEALVLDMRANNGLAANFTFPISTQFYVRGTAGTGSFRLSILYAG